MMLVECVVVKGASCGGEMEVCYSEGDEGGGINDMVGGNDG